MQDNDRYTGYPFLRLLELYILHAIGALSAADRIAMEKLESKLRQIYKRSGSWHEIVAGEMGLTDDFPDGARKNWLENKARAERAGHEITPEEFSAFLADHLASGGELLPPPSLN